MNTDTSEYHGLQQPLELRVLHGPQAGSTLPIEHGQAYTLGTSDNCAVLLSGTQLEPEHASLTVDDDGIQVMPLEGRVMTLDRGEVASGQVLTLGTVLRLGRVKLTVDSVDAPWPHDEVLEEPDAPAPVLVALDPTLDDEALLAPKVLSVAAASAGASASRSRNVMPTVLVGTTVTLLMGTALAAWMTLQNPNQSEQVAAPVAVASVPKVEALDVTALSKSFPEATLQAARVESGKWVVTGRIATEDARRRLREAAAALPLKPEVRVLLDAERLTAVSQFADKRRVAGETELSVERRPAGVIRVVGATATPGTLAALVDAARSELTIAAPLEFQVLTRAELPEIFEERLRQAGLTPKFKVLRRNPQLQLQAKLTGPQVRAWENLFMDFTRDYGSVLTVRAQVEQERDSLERQVEAVVGGTFPYIVTTSGARVAPGGMLDGRTLVAIRDGELLFSDGLRVRYGN